MIPQFRNSPAKFIEYRSMDGDRVTAVHVVRNLKQTLKVSIGGGDRYRFVKTRRYTPGRHD